MAGCGTPVAALFMILDFFFSLFVYCFFPLSPISDRDVCFSFFYVMVFIN
jgi:hypothetical protein